MAMQLAGRRVALAVGIILLAMGTVAVVSIMKQRGEAARNDEIVKIANDGEKNTTKTDSSDTKDRQKTEETKPENTLPGSANQGATQPESNASEQAPASTATELPQTGPADYIAAVPLGMITFAAVGYLQSRRLRP